MHLMMVVPVGWYCVSACVAVLSACTGITHHTYAYGIVLLAYGLCADQLHPGSSPQMVLGVLALSSLKW